ncbi:MAG: hypothetical protein ACHQYQ_05355 [Bacteriovoracales bacterium]
MDKIIHRFFSDISAVVTESTNELMILFVILFLFVVIVLMAFYVFYRTKKLNKMDRQIPASLVQSYLNSIIKNSSELKESLFLGGGEKQNDILALREELKLKEKMINELSKLKASTVDEDSTDSGSTTMDTSVFQEELNRVMAERDELMIKVSDYQKAEKDFINLKKIKEENQELKKQLGIPVEAEKEVKVEAKTEAKTETKPEPAPKPAEEAKVLEFEKTPTPVEEPAKATEPVKETEPANLEGVSKEEKSTEDLLKEFEKMLGP